MIKPAVGIVMLTVSSSKRFQYISGPLIPNAELLLETRSLGKWTRTTQKTTVPTVNVLHARALFFRFSEFIVDQSHS